MVRTLSDITPTAQPTAMMALAVSPVSTVCPTVVWLGAGDVAQDHGDAAVAGTQVPRCPTTFENPWRSRHELDTSPGASIWSAPAALIHLPTSR